MAAVSCGTTHVSAVITYAASVDLKKHAIKSYSLMDNHMRAAQAVCSVGSGE